MFVVHISEADLLLYCLGVIRNEDELAPIEEHLLWCQECLDRVKALDVAALSSARVGFRLQVPKQPI